MNIKEIAVIRFIQILYLSLSLIQFVISFQNRKNVYHKKLYLIDFVLNSSWKVIFIRKLWTMKTQTLLTNFAQLPLCPIPSSNKIEMSVKKKNKNICLLVIFGKS